jgi:hypothetical protein
MDAILKQEPSKKKDVSQHILPIYKQACAAAPTEVVGGILLSGDQLLGVEQLPVCAGTDLIDHGGLQIQEDGTGHVLASTGLREEGVEGIITSSNGLVGGHLTIGLDAVLL